jgi:tight adherence protein B
MDLVVIGVFAGVLATIFGAYLLLVVRPEEQASGAVRRRLKGSRPRIAKADIEKIDEPMSTFGPLDVLLRRFSLLSEPLDRIITQSDLPLTAGKLVLLCGFFASVTVAVVVVMTSHVVAAFVLGVVAGAIPVMFVRFKGKKRLALFEEQFPEAIDLIARALRAGHSLPSAMQMAAEEVPEPVGGEFRLLFDQQNYGLSLTDALRAFGERLPVLDARFFVTAVQTQREMGGNLSEVLDKLAAVIRERFKVKRQIRAVSAHGRITGVVLGVLPLAVAGILFVISPDHIRLLIDDPLGLYMVVTAVILQAIGVVIIRRIVDVEI